MFLKNDYEVRSQHLADILVENKIFKICKKFVCAWSKIKLGLQFLKSWTRTLLPVPCCTKQALWISKIGLISRHQFDTCKSSFEFGRISFIYIRNELIVNKCQKNVFEFERHQKFHLSWKASLTLDRNSFACSRQQRNMPLPAPRRIWLPTLRFQQESVRCFP